MNTKLIPWIIAGALLIWAVIATTCSGPDINEKLIAQREDAYKMRIAYLRADSAQSAERTDSIVKSSIQGKVKDSAAIKAANEQIQYWKKKAVRAVANIPQIARDAYPQIDSALAAKDSVIRRVEMKADTLQASLYRVAKEFAALLSSTEVDKRIAAKMNEECETRRAELLKENEELRNKKLTFKEVLIKIRNYAIAGGVGAAIVKVAE